VSGWTLGRWRFALSGKEQARGLKPGSFLTLNAALKRRSSTVVQAFALFHGLCMPLRRSSTVVQAFLSGYSRQRVGLCGVAEAMP
jgi:hypothetical protein